MCAFAELVAFLGVADDRFEDVVEVFENLALEVDVNGENAVGERFTSFNNISNIARHLYGKPPNNKREMWLQAQFTWRSM